MKAIVDNLKLTLDALLEVKIGMSKNSELLDEHQDFSSVTQLYLMMNGEVKDLINDIFYKLFPEELTWGCQTIITSWQNVLNANFHAILYKALYQSYQSKQVDQDLYRLKILSEQVTNRYHGLVAA